MELPEWALEEQKHIKEAKEVVEKIYGETNSEEMAIIGIAIHISHYFHGMSCDKAMRILDSTKRSILCNSTIKSLADDFESAIKAHEGSSD